MSADAPLPSTPPTAALAPTPARAPRALRGWLTWWWLTCIWVGLGLIIATQTALLSRMPWSTSLLFATRDWAPWIVFSPLVIWLCRRAPLSSATWRRAGAIHALAALLVAVAFETVAYVPAWSEDRAGGPPGSTSAGA